MRVGSLKENEPARGGDKFLWSGVFLQPGESLAGGFQSIVADLGKYFVDCWRLAWLKARGFQFVKMKRFKCFCVAAEQRQKRGVLQQEQPARFVIGACLEGIVQSVRGRQRM